VFNGTADRQPKRRLDFVEYQHRAGPRCLGSQHFEPLACGLDDDNGLDDDGRQSMRPIADHLP